MNYIKHLLKTTALGRVLLIPYRFQFGLRYLTPLFWQLVRLSFVSREIDNITYHLTSLNIQYLIAFVSTITRRPVSEIRGYVEEVLNDQAMLDHIRNQIISAPERYIADPEARYGRRIGWYAFVRALKPKIVVETGTNKGLGTCIIAAALLRNSQEGHPGYLYSTDIDPAAGYLFKKPYADYGEVLYGDSIASLNKMTVTIDLFINDSDHSQDYEMREYEAVKSKLSTTAMIIGDNAHCSEKLWEFSQRTNRKFIFFQEAPLQHWYPGAGMGVSYHD